MPPPDLVIRGKRVVLPDSIVPASIHISDGVIGAIAAYENIPHDCELIEADDGSVVMPGLVDTHVHINEPGRSEWEGFLTATRAAAAGGVTTVIDMPLNSIPPTTTLAGLKEKLDTARGQCYVDVGFWGGVVPGNSGELSSLLNEGVVGFKCFLIHSGVDEFPNVTEDDLREALPHLVSLGALLIVHAELPGPISRTGIPACPDAKEKQSSADYTAGQGNESWTDRNVYPTSRTGIPACPDAKEKQSSADYTDYAEEAGNESISRTGSPACPGAKEKQSAASTTARGNESGTDRNVCPTKYRTFLASRPRAAEDEAVALMIKLSGEFGARVHIVHHSSADSLPLLREARAAGLRITAETCPHYLTFAAEEIPDGATEFKCCPPIRERENREALWGALSDGTIDMIVSDHSPCPPEMKLPGSGDFLCAWGGISSLQLRLPVTWTEASRRGHSLEDISRWLCRAPATLAGLDRRKGSITVGGDADLVIWNPAKEFAVSGEALHHRHKLTPYQGRMLKGVVEKTFLRGRKIYDGGEFTTEPCGLLLRNSNGCMP
jgi:allantoinase